MDVVALYEKTFKVILNVYRWYCAKKHYFQTKNMFKSSGIKLKKLTKSQKQEIRDVWGREKGQYKKHFNYDTHKLVYWATDKFDPKVVPELFVRWDLELQFNNQLEKYAWSDKNTFDLILCNTPDTILRNIDGTLYDVSYKYVNKENAIKLLNENKPLFFKPAIDSGCGKNVRIIDDFSEKVINSLGNNWVVQRIIKVHPQLAKLNATAVTAIRLFTFYIDGVVYMTSAFARIATIDGAVADEPTGEKGLYVGISSDGCLKEYGYYPSGTKIDMTPNGFKFGGMDIPNYMGMVNLVKEEHEKLPHYKFIGWDVTIDELGTPIIIEYNIKGPGIINAQIVNGTLFGSAFDEIYSQFK